ALVRAVDDPSWPNWDTTRFPGVKDAAYSTDVIQPKTAAHPIRTRPAFETDISSTSRTTRAESAKQRAWHAKNAPQPAGQSRRILSLFSLEANWPRKTSRAWSGLTPRPTMVELCGPIVVI